MAGVSRGLRGGRLWLRVALAVTVLLVGIVGQGRADALGGLAAIEAMGMVIFVIVPFLLAYACVLALIEGALLAWLLELAWWRAVGYAMVMNVVSTATGVIWGMYGSTPGWKTSLMSHEWGVVSPLMLKSFVVTLILEISVLLLLLKGERGVGPAIGVAALANALTYALTLVVMLVGVSLQ